MSDSSYVRVENATLRDESLHLKKQAKPFRSLYSLVVAPQLYGYEESSISILLGFVNDR
jgi:hypothetical protein